MGLPTMGPLCCAGPHGPSPLGKGAHSGPARLAPIARQADTLGRLRGD